MKEERIILPEVLLTDYINTTILYAWVRGEEYLYVGMSSNGIGRLGNHHIVGKVEPFTPEDRILIWIADRGINIMKFEQELIEEKKPRYNPITKHGVLQQRNCWGCGEPFKQTRSWQKFCSKECRVSRAGK